MATEIDRLIVAFDADFTRMSAKLDQVIAKNKAAKAQVEASWAGGGGLKAAEAAFDSLAEHASAAASSIPGVGAALAALGPAGIAAGIALGTFLAAAEGTKKFAEFSENLEQTAKSLNLTTTEVQEFDHVFTALGVNVDSGRKTLQALSTDIGNIESGVAKAQQVKIFTQALNITPEQLRGWGTLEEQLPHVLDAMAQMNSQELQGFATRLHLDPGVVASLVAGRDAISGLIDEAHRYGLVVDADVIAKGAEANKELNTAAQIIKDNLIVAFADLAPTIVDVAKALAQAAIGLGDFIAMFKPLEARSNLALSDRLKQLNATNLQLTTTYGPGNFMGPNAGGKSESAYQTYRQNLVEQKRIEEIQGVRKLADPGQPPTPPPTQVIAPKTPKAKATPTDETAAQDAAAKQALDSATRDAISAQEALATTIQERVEDQLAVLKAEHDAKIDALTKKEADIARLKDASDTDKAGQLDSLKAAKAQEQIAYQAQEELTVRTAVVAELDAQLASLDEASKFQQQILTAQSDHYTAQAALATTAKARAALSQKALDAQQAAENVANQNALTQAEGGVDKAAISGNVDDVLSALDKVMAAQQTIAAAQVKQSDAQATLAKTNQNPIQVYSDSLKDLNTLMMTDGVDAAKSLSDGLADAIVNAKSLGDVVSSVFRTLVQQIISQTLQQSVTGPLLSALAGAFLPALGGATAFGNITPRVLPHAAAGTSFSQGGLTLVGEQGPELVNLPTGAQVISNAALRNLGMGSPTQAGPTILFDNRGAVIWEQAARQMMSYADRAAAQAGVTGAQFARSATPSDLARDASRRLG
jgi:hypothetical protein